jgi:hypothetical protein
LGEIPVGIAVGERRWHKEEKEKRMKVKFAMSADGKRILTNGRPIDSCMDVCLLLAENGVGIVVPDGAWWANEDGTLRPGTLDSGFAIRV